MNINELLSYDDSQFLKMAYPIFLGRMPDPDGEKYYLNRLRKGSEKIQILEQLYKSAECGKRNIKLTGFDLELRRYKLRRIPLIGNALKAFGLLGTTSSNTTIIRSIEHKLDFLCNKIVQTGNNLSAQYVADNVESNLNQSAYITQNHVIKKRINKNMKLVSTFKNNIFMPRASSLPIIDLLIDVEWYKTFKPNCKQMSSVLNDYKLRALLTQNTLSPSPYFSIKYYRLKYLHDISEECDPFEHFLNSGIQKKFDPCPLFSSDWYSEKYKLSADEIPFIHYITIGWKLGNSPHPLFFVDFYISQVDAIWGDPLHHYLTQGFKLGLTPNPLFDAKWYEDQINNIDFSCTDSFSDYLTQSEVVNLSPHPLFDPNYYRSALLEKTSISLQNQNLLSLFFSTGFEFDTHPLFDTTYYKKHASLKQDVIGLVHFIQSQVPFTDPHSFFSCSHYLEQRPDVLREGINPLLHYLTSGFSESSYPHPLFDNEYYRIKYRDVVDANIPPLVHYLQSGAIEGRECRKPESPIREASRALEMPLVMVPKNEILSKNTKRSIGQKKGVFAHVFYPDLISEIVEGANNIPSPCTVFISTDSAAKMGYIEEYCTFNLMHAFEIRITENRGRDIAPMIVGFLDRIREVDLCVHIHTKKSKHYSNEFTAWRRYLFEQNLGTKESVENILHHFEDPEVGMIAPSDFEPVASLVQWGGNLKNVNSIIQMLSNSHISVTRANLLEMPTGSMFWFRSSAIEPLLKLDLQYFHFDPESGQVDGTLAHAIERSFFYICEIAGFSWIRFRLTNDKKQYTQIEKVYKSTILPILSGTSVLVKNYPETLDFSPVRSEVIRPRLNLLIPSAELSKGYAGVSEALRLFNELRLNLDTAFDFRIISTDVPISNQHTSLEGQLFVSLNDDNANYHDIISDGTKRASLQISVRKQDIFVASAWWTATAARRIRKWQEKKFLSCPPKFVYLIQDYESGFYPWSTRYMLAEATYQNVSDILPLFNTQILADFFYKRGYFGRSVAYQPPMNEKIERALDATATREKLMLIYMRPHALRNCLEFAEALIEYVVQKDPNFWAGWSFVAAGEDFHPNDFLKTNYISVHGRLSLAEYGDYLSRARIGLSLMVSPHPSYPPLEMAAAGLLVLTNEYENKDLSELHDNLRSFRTFDVQEVGTILLSIAKESEDLLQTSSTSKADWFFASRTNIDHVCESVARELLSYTSA